MTKFKAPSAQVAAIKTAPLPICLYMNLIQLQKWKDLVKCQQCVSLQYDVKRVVCVCVCLMCIKSVVCCVRLFNMNTLGYCVSVQRI